MPTNGEMSKPFGACVLSRFSRVRLLATPWTVASQAPLHRHANTIHLLQCPSWRNQLHTAVICNPQANSPGVCVVLGVIHRGVKVLSCPGCTQPRSRGCSPLSCSSSYCKPVSFLQPTECHVFHFGDAFGWRFHCLKCSPKHSA